MGTKLKVLDGKLSKVEEIQLRIMNLEVVLKDLKSEVSMIQTEVKEEELEKVKKLNNYQKLLESKWVKQSSAM